MGTIEEKVYGLLEQVRAFRRSEDYPDAWERLAMAKDICPKDRHDLQGGLAAMTGQLFRDQGNLQLAIDAYKDALDQFEQHGDQLRVAHTLRHLAEIKEEVDDIEAARDDYEECKKLYEGKVEASKMDLANFYRAYALFLEKDGAAKPNVADFWERARDIYAEFGIEEGVKECESHLK